MRCAGSAKLSAVSPYHAPLPTPLAPRAKTKTAPAKKNNTKTDPLGATPIMNPSQRAGVRRSARLQQKKSGEPSLQACLTQRAGIKRKKRPRRAEARPRRYRLSQKNLQRFNEEMGEEPMDSPQPPGTASEETTEETTTLDSTTTRRAPRSSGTTAYYRYTHLAEADVYVHAKLPDDIQKAVDAIVKARPSDERLAQLEAISKVFHNSCAEAAQAATGGDDFISIFQNALTAMNHGNICIRAKNAWREELKPKVQQSGLNLDVDFAAPGNQQQQDTSSPPRKRQFSYMANGGADSTPPNDSKPPPPPEQEAGLIKTPIPDISIGIHLQSLLWQLALSQHVSIHRAGKFITQLRKNVVHREPDGSQEPMLISVPAPRAFALVFPFAVVESGKQVFEAQNQAAVSGACALKMQLCLDSLVGGAAADASPPLFFSVCTQGPYYELWVHWTEVEQDGLRKFNQALLEVCHGVLFKTVPDFIVAVENVLLWGTRPFLFSIVDRLDMVAKKAAA